MNTRDLLEKDKERLITRLANASSPVEAARECEDELGRILLEYNEQTTSERVSEAAYYSMQTAKAAISLVDSTGEILAYERSVGTGGSSKTYAVPLAIGAGVTIAGALLLVLAPAAFAPVGIAATIGGAVGVFAGGVRFGERRRVPESRDQIFEARVDGGKIYSNLLRMMTVIDRNLEDVRGREQQEGPALTMKTEKATNEELELLAGILESAYARRDEGDSEDIISNIKFYLHRQGIDVVEFRPETERWFNKMPSKKVGTIRPAFVRDGAAVIRGVAAGGM